MAVAAALLVPLTANAQTWQQSTVNGHWYALTSSSGWTSVEGTAVAWGGHLATIRSQAENDWLVSAYVALGHSNLWIGFEDWDTNLVYQWSSGEPVVFTGWASGEPNHLPGERTAEFQLWGVPLGRWNDQQSSWGRPGIAELDSTDCDGNGLPDVFELAMNPGLDSDGNGIHDACEDCNANGVPDAEDIAGGTSADCDLNNVPDECDIAANPALDSNGNGVLDSCECAAANYCQASVNSAGTSAGIGWQGELSLSANNFSLGVSGAPPLKFGIFFYGANQTQMPLGEGQLCVSLDVQRIQPLVITNQQGTALMPIDLTSAAFSSGPFAVTPFSTWNFQFWYRDPAGGPAGFNFSDGLEVTFCP